MPQPDRDQTSNLEAEAVPLVGGRRFWIYRDSPSPAASEAGGEQFNSTFSSLEQEFDSDDSGGEGPIGVVVPISDQAELDARPEPIWSETDLMYAGYLPNGSQARVRYFWHAEVGPGLPNSPSMDEIAKTDYSLSDRYRIEPLAQSDVTHDDVLALWAAEGIVPPAEANRRVHEVMMVAIERDSGLAGVCTVYLQRNAQLGMDLWGYRTYVSPPHRHGQLAIQLLWHTRDHLRERYASGDETRAPGMIMEIENEGLRMYFNKAYWLYSDFTFIGDNERGDHVRVHYFPGATTPDLERPGPKD